MRGACCGGLAIAAAIAGCTKHNPRACVNGQCTDTAYPFCDVDGSFSGEPDTCIAVSCTPMEFVACRGNEAITCDPSGANYDVTQCESTCDPNVGCVAPRVLYVAFVSDRDGNNEIYRMNPDGSMPTNLSSNTASDRSPAWDPTGERIAFLSDRSGSQELYTMSADGSDVIDVSNGQAQEPAWSADGTMLAFSSTRTGHTEIYKAPAHGGTVMRLTSLAADTTAFATWAPDGSKIAFETAGKIYVMNADGTNELSISQGALRGDHHPTWSPNGLKLAFARGLTFEDWDVFVMNPTGTGQTDVTATNVTTTVESAGVLKLPRFRGHPKTGVSDAEETTTAPAVLA